MAFSTRYHGKGLWRGAPSFNGRHNRSKFLTLVVLDAIQTQYGGYFPNGLHVEYIHWITGVPRSTLWRNLPRWTRFSRGGLVRRKKIRGRYSYRIAERGARWLRDYGHLVPGEWRGDIQLAMSRLVSLCRFRASMAGYK